MPPPPPEKLSVAAVQVYGYRDCAAAPQRADAIAREAGFARAHITCNPRVTATLSGRRAPQLALPRNFVGYGEFDRLPASPQVTTAIEVDPDIPFVAATGSVVAYVKVDALLLRLRPDRMAAAVIALEDAGIDRHDIVQPPAAGDWFFVRVRPLRTEQVEHIVDAMRRLEGHDVEYWQTAFVKDCDATVGALSGLAFSGARRHAAVISRAAGVQQGDVLGVYDWGGAVATAVCGLGADASNEQLALRAARGPLPDQQEQDMPPIYAAVTRTISAAWRLKLPPNAPGAASWRVAGDFTGRWWAASTGPFVADGRRADGDELLSMEADRTFIAIPAPAQTLLRASPYASKLGILWQGSGAPIPVLLLQASTSQALQRQIASVRAYLGTADPSGAALEGWRFFFGRADCAPILDDALYGAAHDAIARTRGAKLRYLVQISATTTNVSCTPYPDPRQSGPTEDWSTSEKAPQGGVQASVATGY